MVEAVGERVGKIEPVLEEVSKLVEDAEKERGEKEEMKEEIGKVKKKAELAQADLDKYVERQTNIAGMEADSYAQMMEECQERAARLGEEIAAAEASQR
jgi:uncharacterized coiled-coil DUF342 family protein